MTTLFISDLHLCPTRPATAGLFFDFMAEVPQAGDTLYILGDLFEYWIGDDALSDEFNAEICAAIRDCKAKVFLLVGNRDFLIANQFAEAANCTLLDDEVVHNIEGTDTLLLHGDTLCTDDAAYQAFRKQARMPQWQATFLGQALATRKTQVEQMRAQSKAAQMNVPMEILDVNPDAVTAAFQKHRVLTMVHGHTHRLATHQHAVGEHSGTRHVLGDWHEDKHGGNYLSCNQGEWLRHQWRP